MELCISQKRAVGGSEEEEKHLLQIKGEDPWNGYGRLKKKMDPLWWLQNNCSEIPNDVNIETL
jgi:hypothetical protein